MAENVRRIISLMKAVKHWASAAWETVLGLGFEQWIILASLLLSAGALYFAWKATRASERALRLRAAARDPSRIALHRLCVPFPPPSDRRARVESITASRTRLGGA